MSKIKAEYIWINGNKPTATLRSKTKIIDEEVNSMSVDQYRKWLKKVNKGIKNTSIGDSWY